MILAALVAIGFAQHGEFDTVEIPVLPQFYRPATHGPTLSDLTMRVKVLPNKTGSTGSVTLPVPSDYSGQVVIAFKVQSEPSTALKSWKWKVKADGLNSQVEALVMPPKDGALISYTARVLVPGMEVTRTQRKDFKSWAAPTPIVQSGDASIVAKAKELATGLKSRSEIAAHVLRWVARNKLNQNPNPAEVDAKSSLANGGDFLARANLCAALLRAAGIPARTIAYAATWADKRDAAVWLTEYASEEETWEMIDPTVGLVQPARNSVISLAISSLADEQVRNSRAIHPEAADGTTPFLSQDLRWPEGGSVETKVKLIETYPFASAARLMTGGYRRSLRVLAGAKVGMPQWFDEQKFEKVRAKGPINLALFLDGLPTMPD